MMDISKTFREGGSLQLLKPGEKLYEVQALSFSFGMVIYPLCVFGLQHFIKQKTIKKKEKKFGGIQKEHLL